MSILAWLAVDVADYYQHEHEDTGYLTGLKAEQAETEKALNNLVRAIESGIFSETTQATLTELENRKKALAEAIEAEEIKRTIAKRDVSIQHFFDEYAHADLSDPTIRDYLLNYFIDKIFVFNDRVIMTIWYGTDKEEVTLKELDFDIKRYRRQKESSRASGSAPPKQEATTTSWLLVLASQTVPQEPFGKPFDD